MNLTTAIFGTIKAKSQNINYIIPDIFSEEEVEFIEDICIQVENLESNRPIQTTDLITALESICKFSLEIKNLISLLTVTQYLNSAKNGNQQAPSQLDHAILKIWDKKNEDIPSVVGDAKTTVKLICDKMANADSDDSDEKIETIVYTSLS